MATDLGFWFRVPLHETNAYPFLFILSHSEMDCGCWE